MKPKVFLVQGSHPVVDTTLQMPEYPITSRHQRIMRSLLKEFVAKDNVDHIFFDNFGYETAESANKKLENPMEYLPWAIAGKTSESTPLHRNIVDLIQTVRECRIALGKDVRFYTTEPEDVDYTNVIKLRNYVNDKRENLDYLTRTILFFSRLLPLEQQRTSWLEAATDLRDQDIYTMLQDNAGDNNFLFMGSDHRLQDLVSESSDFDVLKVWMGADQQVVLGSDKVFDIESYQQMVDRVAERVEESVQPQEGWNNFSYSNPLEVVSALMQLGEGGLAGIVAENKGNYNLALKMYAQGKNYLEAAALARKYEDKEEEFYYLNEAINQTGLERGEIEFAKKLNERVLEIRNS